ncbi:carboxymuconolactone decarboxylase family protein, partial [Streptomyces rochei]|uniref:carboxymuconolactone decarboxylase family protein n=1 Tax=Streptomyces rochei TaxID=1928 RepID=UPI0022E9E07A
ALFEAIERTAREHLDETHRNAALAAASLMKMTNVMYSFKDLLTDFEDVAAVKPDLRMSAYANHGGVSRRFFELAALAVSAIGKCKPCVRSHTDVLLREEKVTAEALRDAVRLAAAINAVAAAVTVGG